MQTKYRFSLALAMVMLVSCAPTPIVPPTPTPIVPPHAGEWNGEFSKGTGHTGSVSFKVTLDNTIQDFYFDVPFGNSSCTLQLDMIRLENNLDLYSFELSDKYSDSFTNIINGTFDGENSIVGEYSLTYCPGSDGTVAFSFTLGGDEEPVMHEWKAEYNQ